MDNMEVDTTPENDEVGANGGQDQVDAIGILSKLNPFATKHVAEASVSKYDTEYNMRHNNRGLALIFNHKKFSPRLNLNERKGTDRDRDSFKKIFESLGFTVPDPYNDFTAKKIRDELKRVAKMDHSDNDCLVVAIFTHGDVNCVYAYDEKMNPEELWEPFIATKCTTLATKPKLFFIQACRGDKLQAAQRVGLAIDSTDAAPDTYKIPSYADFLIYYSTIPGFYAWRCTEKGSWFVQALCAVLSKYGLELDLLTLFTLVNQMVAIYFESNVPDNERFDKKKQVPCFTSMLTRKLFFKSKLPRTDV